MTTPAVGQISCSMASTLVRHVRTQAGEEAVQEIVRRAGVEYAASYLDDPSNWIWQHEAIALLVAAAEVLNDPQIGLHVGEQTVRQHAGTPVATMLRSLGSPEAVYEQLTVAVSKFSTTTDLSPEVEPGRAVVQARSRNGFPRHPLMCDWTRGLLSQPPALFGAPPASVEETECQARGGEHCHYVVTWDADLATADPQLLATALETQLSAMTQRLDSMYATARDLIAVDDLDGALARITERAADAARAPKYLLAVRTSPGDPQRVHQRGYVDEDIAEAARALLEDTFDVDDTSRIVVEVASATRHYGRLMADSSGGAFFAHEREMLDVYARYAATVLDTATALDEARSREEQSRALLQLSRAVAAASTSDEVARRLAEVVPAVVDCDRVATFIWDEAAEELVCRAVTGHAELVKDLRIRPSDTPLLAALVERADPAPIFLKPDEDGDPFVGEILRQTGSQALIVVPIVAHERFYGSLHVSVAERPERLQPTSALLELLEGVVAQTATALDNARLIETMAHQARFDNLTGLLGHRAFHEALEIQLERGSARFTLASIDIDDFKLINDMHGHPVGDEALRRVAETLRRNVGEHDSVFRVGGEEFAVLLAERTAEEARPIAERLREAVARVPFALPLRVSIGLASWPVDAEERDALLERADDALYAAKRSGKNRVVGAGEEADAPAKRSTGRANLLDLLRTKDGDTLTHSARVAALAVDTGRLLGLDVERLAVLRTAAQLHDIGKLALPDAVLNKPGPLDEEELKLVRTHPVLGAELVRAWGEPAAAQFVLEHHERVDGSGYPAGLRGEEISLEGRILHVVDAFAAMTSDRPYCAARSAEEAIGELRAMTGTQFDPEVAEALEQVVMRDDAPDWTVDTVARVKPGAGAS